MADWDQVIASVRKSVVSISVIYDGKLESYGTGTVINEKGTVLTAGHVVELVKDFSKVEISKTQILISGEGIKNTSYRPLVNSPKLSIAQPKTQIVLDIALLVPLRSVRPELAANLDLTPFKIVVGEEVVMAGYSEETPFPFDFDRTLRDTVAAESTNTYDAFLGMIKPPTWKSGMVAHTAIVDLGGIVAGQIIHVDNGMHPGASGGPIFNRDGTLVALITDRAMVSAKVLVEEAIVRIGVGPS